MIEQAENLREGDVFLLAGKRCTAEHISREENTTRIVFSFLDNPDDGGIFVCRSDTDYTIMLNRRFTTI